MREKFFDKQMDGFPLLIIASTISLYFFGKASFVEHNIGSALSFFCSGLAWLFSVLWVFSSHSLISSASGIILSSYVILKCYSNMYLLEYSKFQILSLVCFTCFVVLYFFLKRIYVSFIGSNKKIPEKSFLEKKIKKSNYQFAAVILILVWLIIGQWIFNRVHKGFTSPEKLAKEIHDESSYETRIGAFCNDGTKSTATGSGACSHHGGVEFWDVEIHYNKTYEKSYSEALELSWLD